MAKKHLRAGRQRSSQTRKDKLARFLAVGISSIMLTVLAVVGADWYFSLPQVYRSAETGEVVAIEDGRTGKPIPKTNWVGVLGKTHESTWVP